MPNRPLCLWLGRVFPQSETTNPNTYPLQSAAMYQAMPKDSYHGDCLRQRFNDSLYTQKHRCAGMRFSPSSEASLYTVVSSS